METVEIPKAAEYLFDHIAQIVPDIAKAVAWYEENIPGVRVLHQDVTWAIIAAGGVRIAFVTRDEHPGHIGFQVSDAELTRLAALHHAEIKPHRDQTRSFYVTAPGGQAVEFISIAGSRYAEWIGSPSVSPFLHSEGGKENPPSPPNS